MAENIIELFDEGTTSPGYPLLGLEKNCKSFVLRTMLFLKVSKTIIQESNVSRSTVGWVDRYVYHSKKFSCNYFPLGHINGMGVLDYAPNPRVHLYSRQVDPNIFG